MSMGLYSNKISAVLGPTNTGKTYLAIERMLGHRTGMMGFPLRLLARENYDRVVGLVGKPKVALVTGEEKILPSTARYFLCTVESMPVTRLVDFLCVDEIQLCADPERGHLFTDRLLRARGQAETMFLGSESVKPVLRQLVPDADFITRPRFSNLSYSGPQKLTRIKRRSAIVAFSAGDVYALAEQIRRTSGGAAVVLGALSPRTRNAQVQMYQEGEVDYLVATDAIGMGLNMSIDHVALWQLNKFDGLRRRPLALEEIAQIAGRAGRFMQDGTFGTSVDAGPLEPAVIDAVENHRFQKKKSIWWRNNQLNFQSLKNLLDSLDERPPSPVLKRVREAGDQAVLRQLSHDKSVADLAINPDMVKLLWEVCQIPDFRKTLADMHARLLGTIYHYLAEAGGRLPIDWVAGQMGRLERVDGDIDTLMARIAHTRTWTYISHRTEWIDDAADWQARARLLEDRLSDALHDRLTQRFVDRRSTTLVRSRGKNLEADVSGDHEVFVEGMLVGQLMGLNFIPDMSAKTGDRRLLSAAAHRGLHPEILRRVTAIEKASDDHFIVFEDGTIQWRSQKLGSLKRGRTIMTPQPQVPNSSILPALLRDRVVKRLTKWSNSFIERRFTPLFNLPLQKLSGPARGLIFQLRENLGSIDRCEVREQISELSKTDRKILKLSNIKIGPQTIFVKSLLKPKVVNVRSILWAIWNDLSPPTLPPPGITTLLATEEANAEFFAAIGYSLLGNRFVRIDILDRIAVTLIKSAKSENSKLTKEIPSMLGLSMEDTELVIAELGYTFHPERAKKKRISKTLRRLNTLEQKALQPKSRALSKTKGSISPFAKLKELEF